MRQALFVLLFLLGFSESCFGQLGIDNDFWRNSWSCPAEHHKSVVVISCNYPGSARGGGTGVYIEGGFFLTAAHVVDGATSIKATFDDGSAFSLQLKRYDAAADFAILSVLGEEKVKAAPAKISKRKLVVGDIVEVCGHAGLQGLRHFSAAIEGFDGKRVVFDGYAIQGDSGGPIFNNAGEVVAIVSGGALWHEEKIDAGYLKLAVTTPIIGPDVAVMGIAK